MSTPARWRGGDRRGLTLTEVLLVCLVFALIGGVSFAMVQSSDQTWRRTEARLATLTQAQMALDRLSEGLRQAKQAGLTCGPSTLTFTPVGGPPTPPSVTYQLNGTNLVREVAGVPQIVASGVQAFAPTCAPGGAVVQLRLTAQVNLWQAPMTVSSQVWVQNP